MIGAQAFLDSACTRSNTHKILNSDQIFLLNEIGETIFLKPTHLEREPLM